MRKLLAAALALFTFGALASPPVNILESQIPSTNYMTRQDYIRISSGPGHSRNALPLTLLNLLTNMPEFPTFSGGGTNTPFGSVFFVTSFGAVHDGVMITGGAITAGNNLLNASTANFVPSDVGKVISVVGAGASSNTLTTTITSVVDPQNVTLNDNAQTTVLAGDPRCFIVYGHDDTSAIQNALNACFTAGGDIVFFPRGIYIINGAIQDPGDRSTHLATQLKIPYEANQFAPYGIKLLGTSTTVNRFGYYWITHGSMLWSTMTSGTGALLTSRAPGGGWNYSRVDIQNMAFRCSPGAAMSGIDLQWSLTASIDEVMVDTGYNEYASSNAPPAGTIGIILPGVGNAGGGSVGAWNSWVGGFETGIQFGEHALIENCSVFSCYHAYWPTGGGHIMTMLNCNSEGCKNQIKSVNNGCTLLCSGLTVENTFTGWWSPPYLLDDNGALSGIIEYLYTTGGGQTELPLTNFYGGAIPGRFCAITHLKTFGYPDIPGGSGSVTGITNNFTFPLFGSNTVNIINAPNYAYIGARTLSAGDGPVLTWLQNRWGTPYMTWQYGLTDIGHFVFDFSSSPGTIPWKAVMDLSDGLVTITNTANIGTLVSSNIVGNGASITNINGTNINAGTVAYSYLGRFTNHTDVFITSLAAGNVLGWDGTKWTNGPASGGGGSGGGGTNSGPITLTFSGTNVAISCVTPLGCVTNAPLPFRLTMTTNALLQNPTGTLDSQKGSFELVQDATGGRVTYWDTKFIVSRELGGTTAALGVNTNANKHSWIGWWYSSTLDQFVINSIFTQP